jgi:hypothetical protein
MFPRPAAAGMSLQKQPMLLHQPIDALGVDRFLPGGSPLAFEERGDPPIAIARPLIDQSADVRSKLDVADPVLGAAPRTRGLLSLDDVRARNSQRGVSSLLISRSRRSRQQGQFFCP